MKTIVKFSTSIATAAIALAAFAPATFAANSVVVAGNGVGSFNGVTLNKNVNKTAVQTNSSFFTNFVGSNTNSGGNVAAANTGGFTTVNSGAANSNVGIVNGGSTNMMAPSACGCMLGNDTNVALLGNGAGSFNGVTTNTNVNVTKAQSNSSFVFNGVSSNANSGNNAAVANTGTGTTINSGSSNSNVGIVNGGSSNSM